MCVSCVHVLCVPQSGKLVEGEAEEEEEVGRQAGLGDYFFGVPKNAEDDERVCSCPPYTSPHPLHIQLSNNMS
jgi:hypothetical protein